MKRLNESVNIYTNEAKINTVRNGSRRPWLLLFDVACLSRRCRGPPKLNVIPPGPNPDERNTTLGPLPPIPPCPILPNISAISEFAKNRLNNSSASALENSV